MLTQKFQLALGAAVLSVATAFTPANDAEAHPLYDRHGHRIPHMHVPPPVYVDPRVIEMERQREIREYNRAARNCIKQREEREYYYDPPPMSRWCLRNGF